MTVSNVPCEDCPWTRTCVPGTKVGLATERAHVTSPRFADHAVMKAKGVFGWNITCHMDESVPCAGIEAFRANAGIAGGTIQPGDPVPGEDRVFRSEEEFRAHHAPALVVGGVVEDS